MKLILVFVVCLGCFPAFAKNVKAFNQALIEDVQKDLNTENDDQFKVKKEVSRKPASVQPEKDLPDNKVEKLRQIGPAKW